MKPSRFPNTRWSLVRRASAPDEATRGAAITALLTNYRPALRQFLIEGRRLPADTADDLLQGFITEKVLAKNLLALADSSRGKFRSFLLSSLNNFVTSHMRRLQPITARTVDLDYAEDVAADAEEALQCFEREWVQQVIRSALLSMQTECTERRRPDLWEIFQLRVVNPALWEAEPVEYAELVARFKLASPRQAINLLASSKRIFARHLRAAIGQYAPTEREIDEEIADLRAICSR
jgi:DNA-directed RNA polymerase specialized sigma24 family protein